MHWCEPYIGQAYQRGSADCLAFFVQVSREVFHRSIPDGAEVDRAASGLGRCAQMQDGVDAFSVPTTTPQEGDAVLMVCAGRPSHIGVYCVVDQEPSVLHAMENAGMVVRHTLRELTRHGLKLEGFYAWKG